MTVARLPNGDCVGGIFDLSGVNDIPALESGKPSWVVGLPFLMNVYSVFQAIPPSVGFATLSVLAGGSVPWCVVSPLLIYSFHIFETERFLII